MTWRLRSRLTLSYLLVALLSVVVVSVLANFVLEASFRRYVATTQEQNARQVAARLGSQLGPDGWDQAAITAIGMAALEQGMIVKLSDASGSMVWDATVHNNGLCVQMLNHIVQTTSSRYPNWQGSYSETSYPVRTSFREVGSVAIGYYGPFFLDDQELAFINSLNRLLAWVALGALGFATAIGLLSARRITVPLARVALATQRIAEGRRDVRIVEKSRIRELDGISTAVNELSRSLGEQEALRRRLTADMAHELRTPLATLQSHLEALVDGVWKPDADRLADLHEEILRLNRLVSDMENLARFEGGATNLSRVDTDVVALVDAVVRNHEAQFRAKGVALRFHADGPAATPCDPDRLSQAVINLLSNALKYTPAGGTVDVTVTGGRAVVEIAVADTGVGIAAEDLPRIFERFYRADSSRARATGGCGIGLSIARAIVEAHGGTIGVESEPGRGSEFRIILLR